MAHGEDKKVDVGNWKDWFLKKTVGKFLVPDTNFIYRHYGSTVLARLLDSDFAGLKFRIPRLVVLEIERRGNAPKPKELVPGRNKRLAFYAASEINYLRQKLSANSYSFDMLAPLDGSLLGSFSDIAGTQFVDTLIRQEIHDTVSSGFLGEPGNVLFLTCDLMNALAGEAEGIRSCYFNRLPQDSYFVGNDGWEQLSDFIIATAMLFDEIRLDVILEGDTIYSSSLFRGMWGGKTTSQWYSNCVEETPLGSKS